MLITEPAFGRLLPMPFLGGWGGWLEVACQLALMAALEAFAPAADRRAFLRDPGVDDLVLNGGAFRAAHGWRRR